MVQQVLGQEHALKRLEDADLRKQSLSLAYQARTGESLDKLLPAAFALVREAAHRQLSMRHFPVQLLGGITLHHGGIAEMQTGEGKTLTATLPLYLNALAGHGAHLATANDYLAKRDADLLRPIYESLGLSVGVIQANMPRAQRQKAYQTDITYGTAKEFGFDFLKDRLLERRLAEGQRDLLGPMLGQQIGLAAMDQPLQRKLWFALVDEADSVLIDDARTPLILSAVPTRNRLAQEAAFVWAAEVAMQFQENQHFRVDPEHRKASLTVEGRRLMRSLPKPEIMQTLGQVDLYEYVERGLGVLRDYQRDQKYVVQDGEVVIVDESTGRLAEGRKWRDGVHQAVEAKEGLPITLATTNAAQITVQQFFRLYHQLAGMTGTAVSAARELRQIYNVSVIPIPTHRPANRRQWPDQIFPTLDQKWAAVARETQKMQSQGRPVLVGTRSIDKSEALAAHFQAAGITFEGAGRERRPVPARQDSSGIGSASSSPRRRPRSYAPRRGLTHSRGG
jgi:preprotein translocase subunit SecA